MEYISLPIFFNLNDLKIFRENVKKEYGVTDIKCRKTKKNNVLELTVGDEIICYNRFPNGFCKLSKIKKQQRKENKYVLQ